MSSALAIKSRPSPIQTYDALSLLAPRVNATTAIANQQAVCVRPSPSQTDGVSVIGAYRLATAITAPRTVAATRRSRLMVRIGRTLASTGAHQKLRPRLTRKTVTA